MVFLDGHSLTLRSDQEATRNLMIELCQSDQSIVAYLEDFDRVSQECEAAHLAARDLESLFETYKEVVGIWWFSIMLADELQKYLLESKRVESEEELARRIEPLRRSTWLEDQTKEIKKLARLFKERGVAPDDVAKQPEVADHAKRFEWFGTHHWMGEPYTVEKCASDILQRWDKPVFQEPTSEAWPEPICEISSRA
jgi:hypothetical protein